jgi:DNA-binding response OmpR family regulator
MSAPTIALLDDDEDLRQSVAEIFDVLGQNCLALPSVAAIKAAREEVLGCELVILDVNLGDGQPSGIDAYQWLRSQRFAGKIAFLTGHARSHPLVARAAALGERVLQKPITTSELRALAVEPG